MTTPAASEIPPAAPPESQVDALPQSPYRNLWVPLIVVPALIGSPNAADRAWMEGSDPLGANAMPLEAVFT